jgi:hypothetical protein
VTSTEHNNASNTTADIATTTALVVDRAPVMGGRIVLVLSQHRDSDREQDHSVRLLPPSSRDRRRLVFTLAIGDRTHLFRKDKTLRLRLRATSEREYVQWTSAITTAIAAGAHAKTDPSSVVTKGGSCNTNTNDNDDDEGYNVRDQLDEVRASLRLSLCETVATSSSSPTSSTLQSSRKFSSQPSLTRSSVEQCASDLDNGFTVNATVVNTETSGVTTGSTECSSDASAAARNIIASAVASCEASESWRGSSVARQQLTCRAIRQIPCVVQWDAHKVIDAMRLEAARDVVVDHQYKIQQQQQQQQHIDASAVCEQLSTVLDASVYILMTPTSSVESSASLAASVTPSNLTDAGPDAEFFAYDAKQRVVCSRSAVEWLSALTGELVTARRCPVILKARDLDLVGCSLLRFTDVVSASPVSASVSPLTDGDCVVEDDDSQGTWV